MAVCRATVACVVLVLGLAGVGASPIGPPPPADDVGFASVLNENDRITFANEFRETDANHDNFLAQDEFNTFRAHQQELIKLGQNPDDFIDFHSHEGDAAIPSEFRASVQKTEQATMSFWKAFFNSVAMIISCEIGDKTFFIAAILAMRHPRLVIWLGAVGALALMTVLSAAIGFALPSLLPRQYTHYAATALFAFFGVKLLKEAFEMSVAGEGLGPGDELEEAEEELKIIKDAETGSSKAAIKDELKRQRWFQILTQAFTMTFLAEWGDRSQIATIALAAAKDPLGVTVGGILGHAFCTTLAVIGGRLLASKISERTVNYAGGSLFFCFALHSLWAGADTEM